ncbi:MAG: AAA family ATPase, partial [Thiogranum sp.]
MLDVYRTYYRMTGEPFRLSPDHRFSLAHSSYANAKAYLQYAIFQGEGFIAVTGGPGTGKTTLISDLIEGLDKEHIEVATLTSTQLESRDLLQMVVNLFDLRPEDKTKPGLLQELEHFLNQQSYKGRRVILIVDEAQGLSTGALEELRLLANLQRNHQLLLQVFLVGQEQLLEMLRAPGMEHLHQRLIAASHLQPLSLDEVIDYIEHRLSRVGWKGDPSIDEGALRLIHQYSGGVPRRINLICNRLFLYGGLEQKHDLVAADARLVIDELHKEFLLSADADSVNSQEAAAEPDTGADTPVRRLPRRDMNAAPEQAADEAASPQEPRKTRRKPEKAKPRKAARPPGRKRNSPEQVTPSQVSGRKRRIEPTMRRDPTIGAARPAPAPEPVAKKRSWGKVAFVVLLIGFFYAAYYGDDEFNKLLGLLENSDEAKPQVTFSKPLDTTVTTEEPVPVEEPAPVPETVGVTAEQAETGGDGLPVETVADTDEVEADEAEVSSDTPSPAVMAETPAVSEDSLPEEEPPAEPLAMQEETAVPEPGNTAEPDNSTAVAEAEPPQPAEVVEPEPVKVDAASVEAEKARLRRELGSGRFRLGL